MEVIVGEGGHSLDEYWGLRSVAIAEMMAAGVRRRYRAQWETMRVMAQSVAALWVKDLPEHYPLTMPFPWEEQDDSWRTDDVKEMEASVADKIMDRMLAQAAMHGRYEDTDKAAMHGRYEDTDKAAKDGGDTNTERE